MKAYELLADPKNWTKGAIALDRYKRFTKCTSPEACQWCLLGAIAKCYDGDRYAEVYQILTDKVGMIPSFNDDKDTKHADIIKVLKELDI